MRSPFRDEACHVVAALLAARGALDPQHQELAEQSADGSV